MSTAFTCISPQFKKPSLHYKHFSFDVMEAKSSLTGTMLMTCDFAGYNIATSGNHSIYSSENMARSRGSPGSISWWPCCSRTVQELTPDITPANTGSYLDSEPGNVHATGRQTPNPVCQYSNATQKGKHHFSFWKITLERNWAIATAKLDISHGGHRREVFVCMVGCWVFW